MAFLFNPCKSIKTATIEKQTFTEPQFPEPANLTETLFQLLAAPNIASKESVIRTYDHEVKGNTTLKPLQGEYAGPNDAAVLKPLDDSQGVGNFCMNPNYGKLIRTGWRLQLLMKQCEITLQWAAEELLCWTILLGVTREARAPGLASEGL